MLGQLILSHLTRHYSFCFPFHIFSSKFLRNSFIKKPDIRNWKNLLNFKHGWWHKTKSMLFSWTKIPCYSQLNKRKCHFKRKIIRTFKGIHFQWFQEHLIHINFLEVNAFRGTAQAVGKRVSIYKMVPI